MGEVFILYSLHDTLTTRLQTLMRNISTDDGQTLF